MSNCDRNLQKICDTDPPTGPRLLPSSRILRAEWAAENHGYD